MAYHDDVVVLGGPAALEAAWGLFTVSGPARGYLPQTGAGKSQLYLPPATLVPSALARLERTSAPCALRLHVAVAPTRPAQADSLCLAAEDHSVWQDLAEQRRRRCQTLRDLCGLGVSSQQAFVLLRTMVVSDATWHARALHIPKAVAHLLDARVADAAAWLLQRPLGADPGERLFHATRSGGMGFTSLVLVGEGA